jgi:hypothetical protein
MKRDSWRRRFRQAEFIERPATSALLEVGDNLTELPPFLPFTLFKA